MKITRYCVISALTAEELVIRINTEMQQSLMGTDFQLFGAPVSHNGKLSQFYIRSEVPAHAA